MTRTLRENSAKVTTIMTKQCSSDEGTKRKYGTMTIIMTKQCSSDEGTEMKCDNNYDDSEEMQQQ